jgi:hypothetical protein
MKSIIRRGNSLFDYDEAFISPCSYSEINSGGLFGKLAPMIRMIWMKDPDREKSK